MIKSFNRPTVKRAYRAPWSDSVRWRKERISFLSDNPLCNECIKDGLVEPATIVDHITNISSLPIGKRQEMFWNQNNWQPLCKSCHDSKSGRESHG